MERPRLSGLAAATLLVLMTGVSLPVTLRAGEADLYTDQGSLAKALKKGKATISFRYRWEQVEDDLLPAINPAFYDEGYASTLRTTLAYQTSRWVGFSGYIQFEDVSNLGAGDKHNSTNNNILDRPVVADPTGVELQQAYIRYTLDDVVEATLGRLEFNLDDQRFIGAVAWRQNHQSFDLIKVDILIIPRTKLTVAYLDQVNRIFGDAKDMSTFLLNAAIKLGSGNLTPYIYLLDFEPGSGLLAQSSSTYGISWVDAPQVGENWSIPYRAEYAIQKDAGDNPFYRDVEFAHLEVGGKYKGYWFKGGYELLGGSREDGQFSTPLATLHKFNGWADVFLVTPVGGLQDLFVAAGGSWSGSWSAMAAYHFFSADNSFVDTSGTSVSDYGTEFDARVTYTASWKQTFSFKLALYRSDGSITGLNNGNLVPLPPGENVSKFWLYTTYKF
jgi:hypothetical protein